MADEPKDVTAASVKLEIVRVGGTGDVVARLILLDGAGIALAGAVMDMKEFRELLQRFSRSFRAATGSSFLL